MVFFHKVLNQSIGIHIKALCCSRSLVLIQPLKKILSSLSKVRFMEVSKRVFVNNSTFGILLKRILGM